MLDALSRVLALAMLRSFATFKQGHDFSSTTAVEANLWTPYLQFLQRPSAQQADALIRADLNSLGAFTILMTSLSRAQCDDAAIAVFDMLLARKGNTLDVVVYNVAMRALANLGKVERVVQLLATDAATSSCARVVDRCSAFDTARLEHLAICSGRPVYDAEMFRLHGPSALRVVWSLPTATASPPAASVATNNAIIELNSILDKLQQAYKEPMQRLYQMRSVLKRERTLSPLPTPPPQQEALDSVSSRQPFLDTIPPEELFIQARCALRQDDIVDCLFSASGSVASFSSFRTGASPASDA
ncbi:hypothetical protein F1559_002460 [Cyanidiococcus yangmingshanensis]|uniref:Uncharacterized protein n=1 Tax=Cyanidiococcus yangmingshanensis TaxID=2690220 RepID=A0A7J7IEV1_9RHOD|nr:hypothetical protein F1559_002460 [Cyanidiococcus yangmingshanensis]